MGRCIAIGKLLLAVTMAFLVGVVPVATASADSEQAVSCSLAILGVNPGADKVRGSRVKNSGQVLLGGLDCDNDDLDGAVTVLPHSRVRLKGPILFFPGPTPVRSFSGRLRADAILEAAGGDVGIEIRAHVTGFMVVDLATGRPLVDASGNVTIVTETLVGEWELEDDDVEGDGTFSITLAPDIVRTFPLSGSAIDGDPFTEGVQTIPTLAGVSNDFTGEIEEDDQKGDDGDGDDSDGDGDDDDGDEDED